MLKGNKNIFFLKTNKGNMKKCDEKTVVLLYNGK